MYPCDPPPWYQNLSRTDPGILIIRKPDLHERILVKSMTGNKGHFEKGQWVVESEPSVTPKGGNEIDKRFTEATKSVIRSVDEVMKVTRDLVTTEEGKQYIEKTIKDTQTQIQKSFDGIISRVKDELDKNVKKAK
jgi:hypothetical protein